MLRSSGALLCGLAWATGVQAAGINWDAEIAFTHDDNITRAQYEVDILKDSFVSVTAGANYLQWLDQNHRLVYRGFVRSESFNKYDNLSNVTAGGNLTWQYRKSGDFTATTWGVFVKAAIDEFRSDARDSNLYSLGASARKPITDRISTTAILAYNKRDSDSTVFDTNEFSALVNGDYAIGSHWTLYVTYNYLNGDIVSTSVYTTSPRLNFVNHADAINVDDAFDTGAIAYRLKAQTNVFTLGTNFRIGERHSLDLSARHIDSQATAGIYYKRNQVSLAYLVRF